MLKKILGIIAILIVGVLVYAGMQPADYTVSREVTIQSPPEAIFPYINNSVKMGDWMPWKDVDPELQMQYSGPTEGVGAKSSWDSKGQMGEGEALVVESTPNQSVKTKLEYKKPMAMSQMAEISLKPANEGTVVRWSVSGTNSFMGRVICLFMNMDKIVGKDFEKGLGKLKILVEASR